MTPPRVCILSQLFDERRGGPARQAVLLARCLASRGFEVVVLARKIRGARLPTLPPGVRVIEVSAPFPGTMDLEHATLKNLSISLGWTLGAAAALAVRGRRLDLVHSQGASLPPILLAPLLRRLRLPLVAQPMATGQGVEAGDLRGRYAGLGTLLLRLLGPAHTVAISRRIEEALRADGFPPAAITRIPFIVDEERFRPAQAEERAALRARLGYAGRVVLFVGRLVERKRPLLLLDAFAAARARAPALRLEVLGDGPLMGAARARVRALGLSDAVSLPGFADDVEERLRAADGYVLCSTIEGLPNALLEAMACALPVLSTRISGTEDVLRDGHNGLLIAPDDAAALSAGLARLGAAPEAELARLGAAARATILAECSREAVADRYAALYRELIGRADEPSLVCDPR